MRTRSPFVLATLLMSSAAWAASTGNPLDAERGRTRPLVVVAPHATDPALKDLAQAMAQPAMASSFKDRQITVYTIAAGQGMQDGRLLDPGAVAALMAALHLRADGPAAIVLVGKDGGVKLRQTHLAVRDILGAIDAMPMRRQEMLDR